MEQIIEHCFVPQKQDQLEDVCAYEGCGKPEIEHVWTVEAQEANPEAIAPYVLYLRRKIEMLEGIISGLNDVIAGRVKPFTEVDSRQENER